MVDLSGSSSPYYYMLSHHYSKDDNEESEEETGNVNGKLGSQTRFSDPGMQSLQYQNFSTGHFLSNSFFHLPKFLRWNRQNQVSCNIEGSSRITRSWPTHSKNRSGSVQSTSHPRTRQVGLWHLDI